MPKSPNSVQSVEILKTVYKQNAKNTKVHTSSSFLRHFQVTLHRYTNAFQNSH